MTDEGVMGGRAVGLQAGEGGGGERTGHVGGAARGRWTVAA